MAGHSKWANIKHRKAREDARKGKAWSKCAKAIMAAARNGGDPEMNLGLRYAIEEAKAANMPKDNITNAIRKGTGELTAANYERVMYEGYAAGGVAVMIDALTDNRNRTASDMRRLFEKHGGNLGASNSVAYLFQRHGRILIGAEGVEEEDVMAAALEAGAEDVLAPDESWEIRTEPTDLLHVRQAVEEAGLSVEFTQVTWIPENTIPVEGEEADRVLRLLEALEDHEDVQHVWANFEMPDEQMAAME